MQHGVVDKSGAWYSYKGDRIGQGKENVRTFLKDNPAVARDIETQVRAFALPSPAGDETAPAQEAEA